jgi:ribokinase
VSVIVVGSLNIDLVVKTKRMPNPGETVPGLDFNVYPGGKGLNQAVGAARAGAKVIMQGCLGTDAYSNVLRKVLTAETIIDTEIVISDGVCGTALIEVDLSGQNRIVVVPGANSNLKFNLNNFERVVREYKPKVVLAQLETPLDATIDFFKVSRSMGIFTILNPAPAENFDFRILPDVDLLIPNEFEAGVLTDEKLDSEESIYIAGERLINKGASSILITAGEKGSYLISKSEKKHFPTFAVNSVDTTAAGDAFCGALASELSQGRNLDQAISFASAAGALTTTIAGAVPSLPHHSEVLKLVGSKRGKI